jgi:hypothetical protein
MIDRTDNRRNTRVILPDFDRKRALANRRQAQFGMEPLGDPTLQAKADKARDRKDDGIQVERFEFLDPRLHVAAQRNDLEVGSVMEELHLPPQAAGPDPCASRQFCEAKAVSGDKRVTRIFTKHDSAHTEARRQLRWEVFHAVDRKVDPAIEKGLLDLLYEQALSPGVRKRRIEELVT